MDETHDGLPPRARNAELVGIWARAADGEWVDAASEALYRQGDGRYALICEPGGDVLVMSAEEARAWAKDAAEDREGDWTQIRPF